MGEVPPGLQRLVAAYRGHQQPAVEYIPESWERALRRRSPLTPVLRDDRWTNSNPQTSRRTVDRESLNALLERTQFDDAEQLRAAFALVVVWGAGTTGNRAQRYLPMALADPRCDTVLANTARLCRDGDFITAYETFRLTGIGPSFFTKWFAFAGRSPHLTIQPLILDSRVRNTLRETLSLPVTALTRERRNSHRYIAYVDALHTWSTKLQDSGEPCSPERLEWILFDYNGRRLGYQCRND